MVNTTEVVLYAPFNRSLLQYRNWASNSADFSMNWCRHSHKIRAAVCHTLRATIVNHQYITI